MAGYYKLDLSMMVEALYLALNGSSRLSFDSLFGINANDSLKA